VERNYWVRTEHGRVWGPYPISALDRLRGQLTEKCEVSLDGKEWLPGADFPELRGLLAPARKIERQATELDSSPSQSLGIPSTPTNGAFQNTLPTFAIAGLQQLGPSANTASDFRTGVTQVFDAISIQHGRHSLKLGLDWRWERLDVIQPPSPTGNFTFSTLFTNSQAIPTIGSTLSSFSGNSLASFLLGQVQTFSIDIQQSILRPRAHTQEYFVQDDFKATSRLTINAGLRYTLNFPSTDADNHGAVFNLQTQKLDYLGQNGFRESARHCSRCHSRSPAIRSSCPFR